MLETKVIHEISDLRYLSWARIKGSSGTAGSFLKAYSTLNGKKLYYKLSSFNDMEGIIGHECVNEIIADRLLSILGIDHLHYQLQHANIIVHEKAYETYLCVSEDFKQKGESKTALETYYELMHPEGVNMLDFCIASGWKNYVREMLAVDFLILNRDRHGANIEVLSNPREKTVVPAPLYDHGLSMILLDDDMKIKNIDVMEDKRIQCCVGTMSAEKNLGILRQIGFPIFSRTLTGSDKAVLLEGLDSVISPVLAEKTWELIWKRWCHYEEFRNQTG